MEELVVLQKQVFELQKTIKELQTKQINLEVQLQKDVKEMRIEAEKVLEKCSALVNPYSTKTLTHGR